MLWKTKTELEWNFKGSDHPNQIYAYCLTYPDKYLAKKKLLDMPISEFFSYD